METLAKYLSEAELEVMQTMYAADMGDIKFEKWRGSNLIPVLSAEAAEYAFETWNIRKGDVFPVSYPKTGTVWTNEIIRQILYQDKDMDELSKVLPIPLKCIEMKPCEKFSLFDKLPFQRRMLGSHMPAELINLDKIKKANAKVVYVLRNPKDQIVSWLKFVQSFPTGKVEPIKSMINAGWDKFFDHVVAGDFPMNMKPGEWYPDHILSWYKHRDNKTVYFIYYEDMIEDLPREIRLLAEFLEVSLSKEEINKIAEACMFDSMKKQITDDDTVQSKMVKLNMRKGGVGGWKDYFTVSQSDRIDAIMEEKLKGTDIKFTYVL